MNLKEEILAAHDKKHAIKIANYACSSPEHFKELMDCYNDTAYRLAQRAAWSVSWAARKQPNMIKPFIGDLVKKLNNTEVHTAVIRNAVRVLETIEIPEQYHGEVMNRCFAFIEDPTIPVAIKAFSLTTLFNLSRQYPEIKHELQLIIEERWDIETAAFRSRGKKILNQLYKKQ